LIWDAHELVWREAIEEKFNFVVIDSVFVHLETEADGWVFIEAVLGAFDVAEQLTLRRKVLEVKKVNASLSLLIVEDGLKLALQSSLNRVR